MLKLVNEGNGLYGVNRDGERVMTGESYQIASNVCEGNGTGETEEIRDMLNVHIIKGSPGGPNGKWKEVQAIQREPFIFIQYCGSRWAGEAEGDIAELLDMLAKYKLDPYFVKVGVNSVNPCRGVVNPDWTFENKVPHFIDGPRLYACDGVMRFAGNFENYSYAFGIDTNHKPTIDALLAAVEVNRNVVEAV